MPGTCREAGIGRKTGYQRRAENGGLPPGKQMNVAWQAACTVGETAHSGRRRRRLRGSRAPDIPRERDLETPAAGRDPGGSAGIRTPDQRLRVFVSSTLGELEAERNAARAAIQQLRLAPVMFESGARTHPAQAVYRAYLEQSEIFVGLYWQRYGWVGPGMTVSGLEEEFQLSAQIPRLLYVKRPAPDMEPGLRRMLGMIKSEGGVAYKAFADAGQLRGLLLDDLATLLAERFGDTRPVTGGRFRCRSPRSWAGTATRARSSGCFTTRTAAWSC